MKKSFLFFLISLLVIICYNLQAQQQLSANQVLKKVSERLNRIKTIQYDYHRIDNYPSDNYRGEIFAKTYLDFDDSLNAIGFTFQGVDTTHVITDVYNGEDFFTTNKKDTTIFVIHNASANAMSTYSYFLNSIVSLKKGLPAIIADETISKTLKDTLINRENYYLVNFILENKRLDYLGNFYPMTIKIKFNYQLAVDKITYLPLFLKSSFNNTNDYNMAVFSNYDFNYQPQKESWSVATYQNDYKPALINKKLQLVGENIIAPDWTLSIFGTSDSLKLSSLRGKIVLLDFWFRNCENCIVALPGLDSIYQKYKGENFEMIGVNLLDSKQNIQAFFKAHHPQYKSVMDSDGKIATRYGVDGCPAEFVIDETGKIIYSSLGFDKNAIDDAIQKKLKD